MSQRYEVIRFPLYYAVIDKQQSSDEPGGGSKIVFETRSKITAHRQCEKLNRSQAK